MNQKVERTKTGRFNREWIVPITCGILLFLLFVGLYINFNFTDAKRKVCFNFSFIYFGCVPDVFQKANYYEPNTIINLNDEFLVSNGEKAYFFVKENGQKKDTVTFSSEGEYPLELYVDYKGKVTKVEKSIKIGDATPPVIVQKEVPVVKVGELIDVASYVTITDDRDENPALLKGSIIAETIGEYNVIVGASDSNGNVSTINFKYEVIA